MKRYLLAGAAMALLPTAASAATYDFAGDFGSSVFAYGYGQGANFTAFSGTYANCAGVAALVCKSEGGGGLPTIAATTDGSAANFSTVSLPANTLLLHPGPDAANSDAIVRFIVPTTAAYTLSGAFLRADTQNFAGNGVYLSIYLNGSVIGAAPLGNTLYGGHIPIGGTYALNAGDVLQFNVGNNGEYTYDSTGLFGTITSRVAGVPEPATWAMLVLGFGLAGAAMRRRRTAVAFA